MEKKMESNIFTLKLVDEQLELEHEKFYDALRIKASRHLVDANWNINLPSDSCMSPAVAWLAFQGLPEDVTEQEFIRTLQAPYSRYVTELDNWWAERAVAMQGNEIARDMGEPVDLHVREVSSKARYEIERSLKLLQQAWPEFTSQIERLVHKVVFVGGTKTHFRSGTAVYAFGAVFMNPAEVWNAVHFADSLLHESGHLTLMIKQSFGRMLENLNAKAKSPLRKDIRWLNGILHAAYVLYCICTGLRRLQAIEPLLLTPDEQMTVRELYRKYVANLEEALETLENEGIFSPSGRQFMDELQEARRELVEFMQIEVL